MLAYRGRVACDILPSPLTRLRQQLSAIKIVRYAENRDRLDTLHPLPIVVRAISLAVSAFHQQVQFSRLISDKNVAQQEYLVGCDALRALHGKWAISHALGGLAPDLVSTFDRLPTQDKFQPSKPIQSGRAGQMEASRPVGSATEGPDALPSLEWLPENFVSEPLPMLPGPEPRNLFPELDDTSWMHLDVASTVNANSLTLTNFDEAFDP